RALSRYPTRRKDDPEPRLSHGARLCAVALAQGRPEILKTAPCRERAGGSGDRGGDRLPPATPTGPKSAGSARAQPVARLILIGGYPGTRPGEICGAALRQTMGGGYVDLDAGVFYRRSAGARETKKRQPPVRLPPRLLAHLRRWQRRRLAVRSVIEWQGESVRRINKAFRSVRRAAGLGPDVVPHTLK